MVRSAKVGITIRDAIEEGGRGYLVVMSSIDFRNFKNLSFFEIAQNGGF